jgi:pSer/pThr/pTyr-binding forkhead associated (FHA) protein
VLGRGADAATRLEDASVSRVHARLEIDGDRIRVEDLGSKNGLWLSGSRLAGLRELAPGDELRAGRTVLALALAPEPTRPPEPPGVRRTNRWPAQAGLLVAAAAAALAALLAP